MACLCRWATGKRKRWGPQVGGLESPARRRQFFSPRPSPVAMGVLVARQGEQMTLQEDVVVGSEQERLLLLTSMLGVAEHDLVSTQDRLNAMHSLQLAKDQV